MPRRALSLWLLAISLMAYACRSTKSEQDALSDAKGLGLPTAEGVPMQFISDLPAGVAHELFKNIEPLANASSPTGKYADIRELPFSITCLPFPGDETRCRMVYKGPEIKLKLANFLFQTMAGQVVMSRGCQGEDCKNPFKMWWRSKPRSSAGKKYYDFEVCQIKGLEAGVGAGQRFGVLGSLLEAISGKPDLKGFAVTIEEFQSMRPKFDDDGQPVRDANGRQEYAALPDYRVVAAEAGVAMLGSFPHPGCEMPGEAAEDLVQGPRGGLADKLGSAPSALLAEAPGKLVKFAIEVNDYVGRTSVGRPMQIFMRCQPIPGRPSCEMRYRGPHAVMPVPGWITGIFDGTVEFLRECKNPGCKQYDEATVKLSAYSKDGLEHIDLCSMQGVELFTRFRIPGQQHVVGMPDLKGMSMVIDPRGQDHPGEPASNLKPVMKKFVMGISKIGPYPTTACDLQKN